MDSPIALQNKLLRSLSSETFSQLQPDLELVPLKPRRILHHARLPIQQVYFIKTGLVTVDAPTGEGSHPVEGWLVGREGFTGIPVALGAISSPHRLIVLVEGSAWAMESADLVQAMEALPEFRRAVLGYIHSVLVQTAQIGACNANHPIRGRVARWLLMAEDRLGTPSMAVTHDVISKMLGVRRASVTDALNRLEQAGAISAGRGQITILDRLKLESLTCYCYQVVKEHFPRPAPYTPNRPHLRACVPA